MMAMEYLITDIPVCECNYEQNRPEGVNSERWEEIKFGELAADHRMKYDDNEVIVDRLDSTVVTVCDLDQVLKIK
jgi:hypothetical protein